MPNRIVMEVHWYLINLILFPPTIGIDPIAEPSFLLTPIKVIKMYFKTFPSWWIFTKKPILPETFFITCAENTNAMIHPSLTSKPHKVTQLNETVDDVTAEKRIKPSKNERKPNPPQYCETCIILCVRVCVCVMKPCGSVGRWCRDWDLVSRALDIAIRLICQPLLLHVTGKFNFVGCKLICVWNPTWNVFIN